MNILVTGGAGYIGSILVPQLLNAGHKVVVVDNFMYEQQSLLDVCGNSSLEIRRGDVRSQALMQEVLRGVDVVIPLAAYVGAPLCSRDPFGARSVNHDAIEMMLGLIAKDQLVIMPTTNSAYGSGDANNFCTEESPLNPISQYALDKVEVEKKLMQHPSTISLRLATVFGASPRMRIDLLVNDFVHRAVNDHFMVLFEAHFKRNFIHIRDISRVFLHAIDSSSRMVGNIYNVGLSSANLSKLELCQSIAEHIPDFVFLEAEVGVDPDQRNYIVSNAKLESTGFSTMFDLNYGIKELIQAFTILRNRKYGNI
jgi:nucleoside-diphosphate-sugar epimerase